MHSLDFNYCMYMEVFRIDQGAEVQEKSMAGWATISVMLMGLLIFLPRKHMYTTSYHIYKFTYDRNRYDS